MSVYTISYDLKHGDSVDYSNLYDALQTYDNCHPLESTWIIRTTKSSDEIFSHLHPLIHKKDRLLVIMSIVPNCKYQLYQEDINWLADNNHL